jgi:hypothetical protein
MKTQIPSNFTLQPMLRAKPFDLALFTLVLFDLNQQNQTLTIYIQ